MTTLSVPDVRLCAAWIACLQDFGTEFPHGSGLEGGPDLSEAGCAAFVAERLAYADTSRPAPEGRVHCDYFWITEETSDDVLGFLALRHTLNDFLLEEGGHIGYSVRPSRRREGHARSALTLGLGRAAALGIDPVLVTCDDDNVASARTIEGAGGVLEDVRRGKRRYWIPSAA